MESQSTMILVVVTYIILLIIWGVSHGRKVRSGSDYAIAGRKLPGVGISYILYHQDL